MKFKTTTIPTKITPCPIAEAVAELRFESAVMPQLLPGILYTKFQSRYPKIEPLPVVEIPAQLRDSDPNLMFAPHYKLENSSFTFQMGPKVFSLVALREYPGWKAFYEELTFLVGAIKELGLVKNPSRVGVRYVNFLAGTNVLEKVNASIEIAGERVLKEQAVLRLEWPDEEFMTVLQITNNAVREKIQGSVIDIDVIKQGDGIFLDNFLQIVEAAHLKEKQTFFGLISADLLAQLKPEY